jgi:hypothetical protein
MARVLEEVGVLRDAGRVVRLVALAVTAFVGSGFVDLPNESDQSAIAPAQFVKSIEEDHGTYFRLKVKLTYWGTPQDFDIVVGCNVKHIFYKDGGDTYEAGLVPTVFGRRMYDGKGLVIRPPDACKGQTTANHMVPPDFMPLAVVYDNADALDFGIAYLSDDAYESPLSVLRFGDATIEKATRAEFDTFRREQPNLVTRESHWSGSGDDVLKRMKLTRAARPWAYSCKTYKRFRIPQELRPFVREHWPAGHPHYWEADNADVRTRIYDSIIHSSLQSDGKDDPQHPFASFGPANGADNGLPRRAGGGLINDHPSTPTTAVSPAYYPTYDDGRSDRGPTDPKAWPAYLASLDSIATANVDFRGGLTKGFAYCYAFRYRPGEVIDDEVKKKIADKHIVGKVDGENIVSQRMFSSPWYEPGSFLEQDEYLFSSFQIYLGSTRGDV